MLGGGLRSTCAFLVVNVKFFLTLYAKIIKIGQYLTGLFSAVHCVFDGRLHLSWHMAW